MPNFSGIWNTTEQFQARGQNIWPAPPGAPTIGTATQASPTSVSVPFTAPACTGRFPAGISSYTAVSTPGCLTATGASSPLVVTGLTTGTAYTFRVRATGSNGTGPFSAASNSVTPQITCATYTTAGTFTWVAPAGVTSVSVVAIGGGASGRPYSCAGGGGGGLGYRNNISVTPGSSYTVVVGAGGINSCRPGKNSSFIGTTVVANGAACRIGGGFSGTSVSGGTGGNGANVAMGGGGGAAGYSGNGGNGSATQSLAIAPAGGGGAGGRDGEYFEDGINPYKRIGGNGGGGVGLFGQGSSGAVWSAGGSGGSSASQNTRNQSGSRNGTAGATYGGGGGGGGECGASGAGVPGNGANGAVRIVWPGNTRSFPSTNVGP